MKQVKLESEYTLLITADEHGDQLIDGIRLRITEKGLCPYNPQQRAKLISDAATRLKYNIDNNLPQRNVEIECRLERTLKDTHESQSKD